MTDDSEEKAKPGRNPPAEHQFKPGQTGNKRGRPPGVPNLRTIVRAFARERHRVKVNGRTVSKTSVELLIDILNHKSLSGNVRANKLIESLCDHVRPEATGTVGHLFAPAPITVERWVELYSPKVDPSVGFSD